MRRKRVLSEYTFYVLNGQRQILSTLKYKGFTDDEAMAQTHTGCPILCDMPKEKRHAARISRSRFKEFVRSAFIRGFASLNASSISKARKFLNTTSGSIRCCRFILLSHRSTGYPVTILRRSQPISLCMLIRVYWPNIGQGSEQNR